MLDNLTAAREQMALSLSFHIIFAVFGMGLPIAILYAEYRWIRTSDPVWYALARKWAKAFGVLFAIGAVSGTVLSFEFGLLWPTFMERYGGVFGLAFTTEAFAFFLEAIFLGLYLYGWDKLRPWAHWWAGVPLPIAGIASASFVTTANAWMNTPVGFVEVNGVVVSAEPLAPFLAPATPHQVVHMVVAALMCVGFGLAAVYAVGLLRGRRDAYHRRGLAVGLAIGAVFAPVQILIGDWATRAVADQQPAKLAAIEGLATTGPDAPLSLGGVWDGEQLRGALELPGVLSWLLHGRTDAVITGLDVVPLTDRPPVTVTHLAFDVMVGIGTALLGLAAWTAWRWWRARRGHYPDGWTGSIWYLRAVALAGPAPVIALIAGWIVTEVGRQPWIVHLRLRTTDAVSDQPGLYWYLYATIGIYALLSVSLIAILRRLTRQPMARPPGSSAVADAPAESDPAVSGPPADGPAETSSTVSGPEVVR